MASDRRCLQGSGPRPEHARSKLARHLAAGDQLREDDWQSQRLLKPVVILPGRILTLRSFGALLGALVVVGSLRFCCPSSGSSSNLLRRSGDSRLSVSFNLYGAARVPGNWPSISAAPHSWANRKTASELACARCFELR